MPAMSFFTSLPRELITEVLGRVACSSHTDVYSAKLCCKELFHVAKEDYVDKQIVLDKFPIIQWHENSGISMFLSKCRRSRNPKALFRQGVVDYFGGKNLNSAFECLKYAANSGHEEASYAMAIILVFHGGELKQKGIKILSGMKTSRIQKRRVNNCRQRLRSILRIIWVKNALILNQRPVCCTMHHQKRRRGWSMDEIEEYDNMCEGCICDQEIAPICDALPQI